MKDDETLPVSTPTLLAPSTSRRETLDSIVLGKGGYKFWAFGAILLLAFWSMFTGTVSLRWSAGSLDRLSDNIHAPIHDDLDVLEMEEREKVVKHMWDVYTNSRRIRLSRFWQQAFESAYEDLTSDAPGVRNAAISEIAKMSLGTIDLVRSSMKNERNVYVFLPESGGFVHGRRCSSLCYSFFCYGTSNQYNLLKGLSSLVF